ncbi:MAG: hypothetical protein ACOZCO_04885 [Bacteroidota bacterium]
MADNKKYKLNKSLKDEQLPDDEVVKHKDFKTLRYNYEKVTKRPDVPLYKRPIAFIVLVVVILLLLLLMGEL